MLGEGWQGAGAAADDGPQPRNLHDFGGALEPSAAVVPDLRGEDRRESGCSLSTLCILGQPKGLLSKL